MTAHKGLSTVSILRSRVGESQRFRAGRRVWQVPGLRASWQAAAPRAPPDVPFSATSELYTPSCWRMSQATEASRMTELTGAHDEAL